MQKEVKTMVDFVAPSRNAPLVHASFRIARMVALHKKPFTEAEGVVGPALQIVSAELLQEQRRKSVYNFGGDRY